MGEDRFSTSASETFERRLADARAFGAASERLSSWRPDRCARAGATIAQRAAGWSLVIGFVVLLFAATSATLNASAIVLGLLFTLLISLRVFATFSTLLRPKRSSPVRVPDEQLSALTILIPLLREEARVVRALVDAIAQLDYPPDRLDVKILVEADDDKTIKAVIETGLPSWFEVVPVPPGDPR